MLDIGAAWRPREDEAQIARALRQRHEALIHVRRDLDVVHPGHRARVFEPADAAVNAAPRNRNHHDASGVALSAPRAWIFAEGMTQEELLERDRDEGLGVRD